MRPINKRILSIIPRPVLDQPTNTPSPLTNPIQLNSTSASMAAIILLFTLFSLCFFSACTRRLFSVVRRRDSRLPNSPPSLPHPRRFVSFPPPYGLDKETLQSLPVVKGRKEFGCCVVCLSDFEERDHVKVIPRCGHGFHPSCIDGWLVMHGSCPVCRCSDMVTGSRSYSGFESVMENECGEEGSSSSESGVEEIIEGRERKEAVRLLGRSASWGHEREMGRVGSERGMRRTCSF